MKKRVFFHAAAAAVTIFLLLVLIIHDLFLPVDVFIHANYLLISHLQFLLFALVFYGFSLVLLHLATPSTSWSLTYTAASWLFFLWAFYPTVPNNGVMRRIAVPYEEYLAAQRLGTVLHVSVMVVFAGIQAAYLVYVLRIVRSGGSKHLTTTPSNIS